MTRSNTADVRRDLFQDTHSHLCWSSLDACLCPLLFPAEESGALGSELQHVYPKAGEGVPQACPDSASEPHNHIPRRQDWEALLLLQLEQLPGQVHEETVLQVNVLF